MPTSLPLAKKLLYSCVMLVLFLGLAELTLRLLDVDFYYANNLFPHNRDMNFTDIYDKDHDLFWRLKPNITTESQTFSSITYRTNPDGFRGPLVTADEHRPRVLLMGNSCTFGWGVDWEQTYASQLQESEPELRIVDLGVPGYSSHQGKILLARSIDKYHPQDVVIMFGWNDHWPAGGGIADSEQDMPSQWILSIQNMMSGLKLYQGLRKLTLSEIDQSEERVRIDDVTAKRRVPLSEFGGNLREMIALCIDRNVRPIVVVPPIASLLIYMPHVRSSAFHDQHASYQDTIRTVAIDAGIELVDLQGPFDQHDNLFDFPTEDPVHFNARGHSIVAKELYSALEIIDTSDVAAQR